MAISTPAVLARSPLQGRKRAVVKTLLYRTLMVAITIAIAFLVTGNTGQALSIGVTANVLKTGTYYVYERVWDRVAWGIAE